MEIGRHYKNQEAIAKIVYPFFRGISLLTNAAYKVLKLEGVAFGLRRASWRARVKHLGEYSDISPGVVIKHPEYFSMGIRSSISPDSFVDAGGGIEIGDYVLISHHVSINSQTHPTTPPYSGVISRKTIILDHAWIGAHAVILDGITIGEGAIVAAGSVVTKSVEAWTIVAGIPARAVRRVEKN